MGGLSIWHWLIVLVIVLAVFGTKKLGNIGSDLGKAVRDFKKGLGGDEDERERDREQLQADEKEPEERKPGTESKRDESSHERSGR